MKWLDKVGAFFDSSLFDCSSLAPRPSLISALYSSTSSEDSGGKANWGVLDDDGEGR